MLNERDISSDQDKWDILCNEDAHMLLFSPNTACTVPPYDVKQNGVLTA
jgi:hypothetical protein